MNTERIYDQYGRVYDLPGLYSDFNHVFSLTHYPQGGGTPVTVEIDEPVGWQGLKLTLARSAEWHSVSYEYTSDGNTVEFDGDAGRDFVYAIFLQESEDAEIHLTYSLRTPGFDVVEYRGRLNLATYQYAKRRVSCALERVSLHSRVESKWDKESSILSATSLDGKQITPPDLVDIPLSAQALDERFVCNVDAGGRVEQTWSGDTNGHVWIQFDTSKPQVSEIEELAGGKPMGLSDSEGPVANESYLFKFRSAGSRQISIDLGYRFWLNIKKKTVSIGAAYVLGYSLTTVITVVKASGERKDYPIGSPLRVGSRASQSYRQSGASDTFQGKLTTTIGTEAGDQLYLYGLLSFDHNKNDLQQTQVAVQLVTQRISITGRSRNSASSAKGVALIDALQASLTIITGQADQFRSTYFGLANKRYPVDGCGARRVVINGFGIRKFKPTEKPLNLSLQDTLRSLTAIDCLGMEYGTEVQPDGTLVDVMRVEPIQRYYRPVELLRLDEVANYKEKADTADIISTLDVGYNDYVTEGAGALEEIHAQHQVQTPIRHEQGKKSIIAKFVTSSLAIERTRRMQYDTTQKDGTSYDEKAFLIQCKPIPAWTGRADIAGGGFLGETVVLLDEPVPWLAAGTQVLFAGSPNNNGTYTVSFVSDENKRPWSFYVAESVTPEVVENLTISSVGGLGLQPEIGDDFDQVVGLPSPGDTYNLRLTPGRMLLRNIPIWAGALLGKRGAVGVNLPKSYPYQGNVKVTRQALFPFSAIELDEALDWIAPGTKITLAGPTANKGAFVVLNVSDPTLLPWRVTVIGRLVTETVGSVVIALPDITPSLEQVTKTKMPGNAKFTTVLPAGDQCGRSGVVKENQALDVDDLLPYLLYRPREITFSVRLSQAQLMRLRVGLAGLLPMEPGAGGDLVDLNNGYVSLLNQEGVRVAGWVRKCEWSPTDEDANFTLVQTALDLNDTTSGLDCSRFKDWTIAQVEAADARTRRQIEQCTWIDVTPL